MSSTKQPKKQPYTHRKKRQSSSSFDQTPTYPRATPASTAPPTFGDRVEKRQEHRRETNVNGKSETLVCLRGCLCPRKRESRKRQSACTVTSSYDPKTGSCATHAIPTAIELQRGENVSRCATGASEALGRQEIGFAMLAFCCGHWCFALATPLEGGEDPLCNPPSHPKCQMHFFAVAKTLESLFCACFGSVWPTQNQKVFAQKELLNPRHQQKCKHTFPSTQRSTSTQTPNHCRDFHRFCSHFLAPFVMIQPQTERLRLRPCISWGTLGHQTERARRLKRVTTNKGHESQSLGKRQQCCAPTSTMSGHT